MPSDGANRAVQEGDQRTRLVVAWLPVRCEGRWCWLRPYLLTERFQIDYAGWATGHWILVRREAVAARVPWSILYPLWCLQDALRRLLNRWLYCSLGEHRRDQADVPCKDCGDEDC